MKKYVLPSLVILALGLGLAVAQNINKSIQQSQDPTGAIGVDTNNQVYFPGHIGAMPTAGAPSVGAPCGTSPAIAGTDTAAEITEGTGAVSACGVTFRRAYTSTPSCVVSWQTRGVSPTGYSVSTAGIQVQQAATSNIASAKWNYVCFGNQ